MGDTNDDLSEHFAAYNAMMDEEGTDEKNDNMAEKQVMAKPSNEISCRMNDYTNQITYHLNKNLNKKFMLTDSDISKNVDAIKVLRKKIEDKNKVIEQEGKEKGS